MQYKIRSFKSSGFYTVSKFACLFRVEQCKTRHSCWTADTEDDSNFFFRNACNSLSVDTT